MFPRDLASSSLARMDRLVPGVRHGTPLLCAVWLAACAGAGPYGHAAHYAPLDDEAKAAAGARDYDPVMVQRDPEGWHKGEVSLFGVVRARAPGPWRRRVPHPWRTPPR